MCSDNIFSISILSQDLTFFSPYSKSSFPYIIRYYFDYNDKSKYYWVWSLDTSIIYRGTNNIDEEDETETRKYVYTSELNDYEGDFYSSKLFINGELLYDTYYSKDQYDYLKNEQDNWNLKYFTIGRCSNGNEGWWQYAKMNVYAMRLYNKGLTEDEIVENYNITKAYYSVVTER